MILQNQSLNLTHLGANIFEVDVRKPPRHRGKAMEYEVGLYKVPFDKSPPPFSFPRAKEFDVVSILVRIS